MPPAPTQCRLAGLPRRPEGQPVLAAGPDPRRQRAQLEPAWEYQHRRRQPAIDDARQSDRGERRDVHHDAEPEGGGARRRDGQEIWSFDPAKYNNGNVVRLRNRGVAYWKGPRASGSSTSSGTASTRSTPKTGALITSFGNGGYIDLRQNLGVDPSRR